MGRDFRSNEPQGAGICGLVLTVLLLLMRDGYSRGGDRDRTFGCAR
jgi:hypothetical protein